MSYYIPGWRGPVKTGSPAGGKGVWNPGGDDEKWLRLVFLVSRASSHTRRVGCNGQREDRYVRYCCQRGTLQFHAYHGVGVESEIAAGKWWRDKELLGRDCLERRTLIHQPQRPPPGLATPGRTE